MRSGSGLPPEVATGYPPVAPWALLSALGAPVFLVGGWTVAAATQPGRFDSSVRTISELAALGTPHRWVMTSALVLVGCCHVTTAVGLRPAAPLGRLALAAGGGATIAVAAAPLPADGGGSRAHALAAGGAFLALGAWPALGWRREPSSRRQPSMPAVLQPTPAVLAATVLLGLVGWFGVELVTDARVGLAERVAAAAQACWPLVVVVSIRAHTKASRRALRLSRWDGGLTPPTGGLTRPGRGLTRRGDGAGS